jgi:hypothetical protein
LGIMGGLDMEGARLAADAQIKQAREAMDLQRQIYGQSRADQQPWMQAGQTSLADMLRMLQPGGFDYQADPGFQFRMAEGAKALERSAAARGGLNSGGFARSMMRYGQGLASEEYGNAYNRRFGSLRDIAGMGQGSAQNLGGLGQNYANSMSSLHGAIGNAKAAGLMGVLDSGRRMENDFRTLASMAFPVSGGGSPGGYGGGFGGGQMGIPTQSARAPSYQYQQPSLGVDYSGLDPRWR